MSSVGVNGNLERRQPDVIDAAAGVGAGSPLSALRALRPDLAAYMQASCDAVVLPVEPGGLPHDLRIALACRIALQNADRPLTVHYRSMLEKKLDSELLGRIADGDAPPPELTRIGALVKHSDLLSMHPRDASRGDIEALTAAGISDADIVRLSELVALVSFQVRVIAGLRALGA